ncbi:MAG TPA: hypothetical protein VMU62_03575 [Acidobacteriaceae bacterium]|nr:hypothetical protein [Acidobacteriaceae bacterium]
MTTQFKSVCPTCGAALALQQKLASAQPAVAQQSDREYDRRGILLPQRTLVGGIITPQ